MINFFRRIRQRLVSQNRFSKYMFYAIGEIILVMIGILLALQVNNWNTQRNNSKQEINILTQLQDEYKENLREVNEKIFLRNGMIHSISTIFEYIDNGIENVSLDSVALHFERTFTTPTFDGANGVTNEILNSGNLYILNNSELKSHLTNWSGTTQKMIEEEQFLVTITLADYMEYTSRNFNYRQMMGVGLDNDYYNAFLLTEVDTSNYPIKGNKERSEYEKYLSDPVISNYLIFIIQNCVNTNSQALGLKAKIESVLELIETELNIKTK